MKNIISVFWLQTSQNGAFGRGVSYKYIIEHLFIYYPIHVVFHRVQSLGLFVNLHFKEKSTEYIHVQM